MRSAVELSDPDDHRGHTTESNIPEPYKTLQIADNLLHLREVYCPDGASKESCVEEDFRWVWSVLGS